jgi:hypothetical protein
MIRNRLLKLEKLVQAATANCPGCCRIPGVVWMPGEPEPNNEPVRCARCGKEHRPTVVQIIVPGLPPDAALAGVE